MKLSELKSAGHWPTLVSAFLYFDFSFMVWTLLGALGVQIAESLGLSAQQKGLMVATPILSDACLRIFMGLLSDRIGNRSINHNRLLRRTDRAVIKTSTRQYLRNRFLDIGRSLDKYRNIARPDAKRRLTRRIRRSDKSRTAGREDHRSLAVLH